MLFELKNYLKNITKNDFENLFTIYVEIDSYKFMSINKKKDSFTEVCYSYLRNHIKSILSQLLAVVLICICILKLNDLEPA